MKKVDFHGCAVGVTSLSGKPTKKPWTIATNSLEMRNVFRDKRCECTIQHAHAEGQDTVRTGSYPMQMATLIHKAFATQMSSKYPVLPCEGEWAWSSDGKVWTETHRDVRTSSHHIMTGAPFSSEDVEFAVTTKRYADGDVENHMVTDDRTCVSNERPWVGHTRYVIRDVAVAKLAKAKDEHEEYPSMPVTHCDYDHRDKLPSMPEWSAMVTKQLSNKEILQDPLAQEAMTKEYKRHQNKTWDETK
eukprot:5121071-Amphidinium_carterae.3